MANINLQVGGSKTTNFIVRDATNNAPLSANFSNLQIANTNPEVASFISDTTASDPESRVKAIATAIGGGTINISVDITYVDPGDGVQRTETKTLTKTFEVTGTPHGASIDIIFP